jgi:predicted 3-demethylubiquinone-9 3-methyltransferase (glyoxalase superfamily)
MFKGTAVEAMNFYVSLFLGFKIPALDGYKAGGRGRVGNMRQANFAIGSQNVLCTDSYVKRRFTFPPPFSFYLERHSEEELVDCGTILRLQPEVRLGT